MIEVEGEVDGRLLDSQESHHTVGPFTLAGNTRSGQTFWGRMRSFLSQIRGISRWAWVTLKTCLALPSGMRPRVTVLLDNCLKRCALLTPTG